jgi:hypothetical protein
VTETRQPTINTINLSHDTIIMICAPIMGKDRIHGYLVLGRVNAEQIFTAGEEKLLMAIVQQGAAALEISQLHQEQVKHQLLEKELEVGQRIQQSLLPAECPSIAGWEFAVYYQAAKQVGGDFYDFIPLPQYPDWLAIVIADVTGKGIPAAIYMALCRAIIRTSARSVFAAAGLGWRAADMGGDHDHDDGGAGDGAAVSAAGPGRTGAVGSVTRAGGSALNAVRQVSWPRDGSCCRRQPADCLRVRDTSCGFGAAVCRVLRVDPSSHWQA